jgi:hypothetical protein
MAGTPTGIAQLAILPLVIHLAINYFFAVFDRVPILGRRD